MYSTVLYVCGTYIYGIHTVHGDKSFAINWPMPPSSTSSAVADAAAVFHLVFLRFKREHCTEAVAAAGHAAAQGLLLRIPGVTSARFGRTFNGGERTQGFTHSLCVVFEDRRAFDGWADSPLHEAWGTLHVGPYLDGPGATSIVKIDMAAPVVAADGAGEVVDHTVFFNMRGSFDGQMLAAAKASLQSHLSKIPGVLYSSFGKAFLHKGDAEYALHVKLISKDALQCYADHPLHRQWVERFITEHCISKQALDSASPALRARL